MSFLMENNTPVEVIKAWIGHGSERMGETVYTPEAAVSLASFSLKFPL